MGVFSGVGGKEPNPPTLHHSEPGGIGFRYAPSPNPPRSKSLLGNLDISLPASSLPPKSLLDGPQANNLLNHTPVQKTAQHSSTHSIEHAPAIASTQSELGKIETRRRAMKSQLDNNAAALGRTLNKPLIAIQTKVFRPVGTKVASAFEWVVLGIRRLFTGNKQLDSMIGKDKPENTLGAKIARTLGHFLVNLVFAFVSLPWTVTGYFINVVHHLISAKTYTTQEGAMHAIAHFFIGPLVILGSPIYYGFKSYLQGFSEPMDEATLKRINDDNDDNYPKSSLEATEHRVMSAPSAKAITLGTTIFYDPETVNKVFDPKPVQTPEPLATGYIPVPDGDIDTHEIVHTMQAEETPGWELGLQTNIYAGFVASWFDSTYIERRKARGDKKLSEADKKYRVSRHNEMYNDYEQEVHTSLEHAEHE